MILILSLLSNSLPDIINKIQGQFHHVNKASLILIAKSLIICQLVLHQHLSLKTQVGEICLPLCCFSSSLRCINSCFWEKERKKGSDEGTHSQRAEAYSAATTRLYSIISTCAIYPWLRNIYVVNFIKSTTVSCLNGSYFIKKHIFENIAFCIEISDAHIFSEEQGSCRGAWGNFKFL